MNKVISSAIIAGSFMVVSSANALELAYVSGQYGNLTSSGSAGDAKMGNIGATIGFSINETLFVEGQVSLNISEDEQTTIAEDNYTDTSTTSAQFFSAFLVYKSTGSMYGKARIGLVSVSVDIDHKAKANDPTYSSESSSLSGDDIGLAFGVGGGISVGPGAIEVEYTKLPDVSFNGGSDVSNKIISLGYVYPF